MKNKKILAGLLITGLCMALVGCGSNVAEHSNTYWTQLKKVVTTSQNAKQAIKAAAEGTTTEDTNALAKPANFVVNADGTYSFDAVEGAQYYYVYVYTDSKTKDATATSAKILDDGSASYSGNLADIGQFTYRSWNIRVVAYPDYENSDKVASKEAKADYVVSGEMNYGNPTLGYMWNVSTDELTIKVGDMEYSRLAYPTEIIVTLTNKADASDVVTIDVTDVEADDIMATTTDAKLDAEYSVTAEIKWDPEFVTNPEYTVTGGTAETSSTENLISGDFYYSSEIFNCFNFPHVQKNFDPVNGGLAGMWYNDGSESSGGWFFPGMESTDTEEEDKSVYFEATPVEAVDGALYSYTIHATSPAGDMTATPKMAPGSATTKHIFGTLNIYADGTFTMETEYQYIKTDAMNAAVYYVPDVICNGVYTTNADGTLNLSYDHENAKEGEYDIVTELTGQAAAYAELYPDEMNNESNMGGGGFPGGDSPDENSGDAGNGENAENGTDAGFPDAGAEGQTEGGAPTN